MELPLEGGGGSVTYITLRAVLEAPKNGNAYGIATVFSDGSIAIDGVGNVPTCVIAGRASPSAGDTSAS